MAERSESFYLDLGAKNENFSQLGGRRRKTTCIGGSANCFAVK